jgi:formylglycine-generating enzyme
MARIAGGTFSMGSEGGSPDERPVHSEEVRPFALDRTEVTVAAYARCVAEGKCGEPTGHATSGFRQFCNWKHPEGRDDHPINCVTWIEADVYCRAVGKRLPSEVEWEYAARRPDGRTYPWGEAVPDAQRANACGEGCVQNGKAKGFDGWKPALFPDDPYPETAPVGSFSAGQSADGIMDLAGNVWEWTASGYAEAYDRARDEGLRVNRGGGGRDGVATFRATARSKNRPSDRTGGIGFRCAK